MQNEQEFSFKDLFIPLTNKKAILVIIIVGFILYFNALFGKSVLDDSVFILNNPDIHNFNLAYLFGPNLFNSFSYYRPMSAVYFALLYSLFGSQAFFYHLFQIVLHIVNTILLYFLFRSIFNGSFSNSETNPKAFKDSKRNSLLSLFLSLIFLVHPINVESVAYIASSQSEVFFLFGITALLISFKKSSLKNLCSISFLLLLSLLTKETGILFFFMVLCFQIIFKHKNILQYFIFQLLTILVYFFIRFTIGKTFFDKFAGVVTIPSIQNLSFMERLINIPKIVLYYLTTTLFPLKLSIIQQWVVTKTTFKDFYLPLILDCICFLALFLSGVFIYKHKRSYFNIFLFFFLWFALGLAMLLQIFPLDATVSDRWFYFPLVGILGMLGVIIQTLLFSEAQKYKFVFKYKNTKTAITLIGILIVLILSLRTIARNANFHDIITLYSHDAQVEDNYFLETDLGINYELSGKRQLAFNHLQKSVSIHPFWYNLFSLGLLYEDIGDDKKAGEFYYKAMVAADTFSSLYHYRFPSELRIYIKYSLLLLENKKWSESSVISKKGLQYYPKSSILWVELATSYYAQQNLRDAFSSISEAKSLTSNDLLNSIYTLIVNKQIVPLSLIDNYVQKQKYVEVHD